MNPLKINPFYLEATVKYVYDSNTLAQVICPIFKLKLECFSFVLSYQYRAFVNRDILVHSGGVGLNIN